eukprot:scaffold6705_cov31-Tisochrysis_lutea.AAC.10
MDNILPTGPILGQRRRGVPSKGQKRRRAPTAEGCTALRRTSIGAERAVARGRSQGAEGAKRRGGWRRGRERRGWQARREGQGGGRAGSCALPAHAGRAGGGRGARGGRGTRSQSR